jgi:uncharacterized membrane protein
VSGKRYKKRSLIPATQDPPETASITQLKTEFRHFSGPIPPPELLALYNNVVENGAERILAMAERQSAHRETIEAKVVAGNISAQRMGSAYAFILSLVAMAGGIWLIQGGKSVTGLSAILADLATLAGVFIYSRNKQAKERTEKATTLAQRRGG